MSRTIDERVVSMQFDNKNFENNVKTSLGTLEKLKQSLNFKGASKSLEDLNLSSKKVDISPLGNAAHTVGLKFSAMYTMADQALRNITTRAQHTAESIVKAFTIDPVKTGFSEYETQINAVQTILANTQSKGTTLNDVNAALDELNTYADKTIYNFTQMTRNIGTFTAAGVDLDKSVTSIKGIANLAAVSGSTSQQASTAMYQLSQALAAGRVSLMDWNSVVNAGMGGQLFQDALKRTATQMGHNVDAIIKKYGSFRESLTQGEWLTTEVLTETLTQLSGAYSEADLIAQGYTESQAKEITELAETAVNAATKVKTFTQLMDTLKEAAQSGWTQSWELIVGDFEEAKSLWTGVSDTIGELINKSSEKRNTLLGGALNSNWEKLVEKINAAGIETSTFEEKVKSLMKQRGYNVDKLIEKYGSLQEVFESGAVHSDTLKKAVDKLQESASDINLSDITGTLKKGITSEDVKKTQEALQALGFDLSKFGVDGIFGNETEAAVKAFQEKHGLEVTGIVDEQTLTALDKAISKTVKLDESIDGLIDGITELGGRELLIESFKNIWEALTKPIKAVGKAFREVFPPMTSEQLYGFIEGFHSLTEKLVMSDESAEKVGRIFKGLFSILEIGTSIVGGGLKLAFKLLNGVLEHFDMNILDVAAAAGDALVKFKEWALENGALAKGFEKVTGWIATGAVAIWNWIQAFVKLPIVQDNIARFQKTFSDFFSNLPSIFKDLGGIVKEHWNKLTSLDNFSFDNIKGVFRSFWETISSYFTKNGNPFAGFLDTIKKFRDSVVEYFGEASDKFKGLGEGIVGFFKVVKEKIGDNMGAILAIGTLVTFLLIMNKIKNALEAISSPFEMFSGFLDSLSGSINKFAKAQSIKAIAISIGILAASVAVLALLPAGKVWSAVGALVVLGAGLVLMSKFMGKIDVKELGNLTLTLAGLAGAFLIMAVAAKIIGSMDGGALAKAGGAMIAFVGIVTLMSKLSKDFGKGSATLGFGKMMLKLAGSLLILAIAVQIFGRMKTGTLIKGGIAIASFLGMMVGMMAATKLLAKDLPAFGKTMLSLSASLIVMAIAVKMLGSMDFETLIKGGGSIAIFLGMMVGMMAATKLLAKDLPAFGRTMTGLSFGLLSMALAIKVLAGIDGGDIVKGMATVAAMLGMMALMMWATKLMGKYSFNAGKMGAMMLGFATAILMISGSILMLSMLDGKDIIKATAAIAGIGAVIAGLLYVTKFAKSVKVGTILSLSIAVGVLAISVAALSFIDGAKLAGATAAVTTLVGILSLLVYSTKGVGVKSMVAIGVMTLAVGGLAYILRMLSDLPAKETLTIATALSILIASLSASCLLLASVGATGPAAFIGIGVLAALMGVVTIFAGIAIASLPKIGSQLSKFMTNLRPFLDGAKEVTPEMGQGIKNLAEAFAILTGTSFVNAIGSKIFGGSTLEAFGKQIAKFGESLIGFLKTVGGPLSGVAGADGATPSINYDAVNSAIDAAVRLAELANSIPPTSGMVTWFVDKDLGEFGDQVSDFATGLAEFLVAISDPFATLNRSNTDGPTIEGELDWENISSAVDVAFRLAELANTIDPTSGMVTWFVDKDLSVFGTEVAGFATGLAEFLVAISDPFAALNRSNSDSTTVEGELNWETINSSVDTALKLAEIAEGIDPTSGMVTWFVDKDLSVFGTEVAGFATGLAEFLVTISDPFAALNRSNTDGAIIDGELNWDTIEKSVQTAVDLAKVAEGMDPTSGMVTWFVDKDLSVFGTEVAGFATGLAKFLVTISDPFAALALTNQETESESSELNWDTIEKSVQTAVDLAKVAESIDPTSGMVTWFVDKDLSTFGTEVAGFATGLAKFLVTISDPFAALIDANPESTAVTASSEGTLDFEKITKSVEIAKSLATLALGIPPTSGMVTWFTDKDLSDFGTEAANFGEGLANFLTSVNSAFTKLSETESGESGGINMENITAAVDAATKLGELAAMIAESSSGWDWLTGKDNLGDFGTNLETLAGSLATFSSKVSGEKYSADAVTNAVNAIDTLATVGEKAAGEDSMSGLTNLGMELTNLGEDLGEFLETISAVDTAKLAMVADGISKLGSIGTTGGASLKKFLETLGSVGTEGVTKFASAFEEAAPKVSATIGSMFDNIISLIVEKGSSIKTEFSTVASGSVSILSNYWSSFYSTGMYLVYGFAQGIDDNTFVAEAYAAAMALAALEAAKEALGIESPSKEAREAGGFFGEGMILGIADYNSKIYKAGYGVADMAKRGLNKAISKVNSLVENGFDTQPTIRPVMDLSEVTAGANSINGMFGMSPSVGVLSRMSSISSRMDVRQNGNNSDIVSAIDSLSKKLGQSYGDTYNINGVTYDDGSNIYGAVQTLVHAAKVERRR